MLMCYPAGRWPFLQEVNNWARYLLLSRVVYPYIPNYFKEPQLIQVCKFSRETTSPRWLRPLTETKWPKDEVSFSIWVNRGGKRLTSQLLSNQDLMLRGYLFTSEFSGEFDPTYISGWWFGTMEFYDFPYVGNNHPNWLSYFSVGLEPPTRSIFTLFRIRTAVN